MLFICCSVNHAIRNTLAVQRRNFGKGLILKTPISERMQANMVKTLSIANMVKTLSIKGNRFHKPVFFSHSFENGHNGAFRVGV